jgi:hypothetical protein
MFPYIMVHICSTAVLHIVSGGLRNALKVPVAQRVNLVVANQLHEVELQVKCEAGSYSIPGMMCVRKLNPRY